MKNIILGVVGAILVVIIAVLGSLLWQSGQNNGNDKGIINNEKVEISNGQNELNMKNNNQDNGVNKSEQVVGNSAIANQIKLKQFTDKDFGISFEYLSKYIIEKSNGGALKGDIPIESSLYVMNSSYTKKLSGANVGPKLIISKSRGNIIFTNGFENNKIEDKLINGVRYQKFQLTGMGEPYGYFAKQGDWYYTFEIAFAPKGDSNAQEFENIMKSVKFIK